MIVPIFIVGYLHSGTSLLHNLLGNHSLIFQPAGEIKFFENLPALYSNYRDLSDLDDYHEYAKFLNTIITSGHSITKYKEWQVKEAHIYDYLVSNRNSLKKDHESLLFAALDFAASESQAKYWVEKSPNNIFYLDRILAHSVDAKVIELIRDGRDILASKKVRKRNVNIEFKNARKQQRKALERKYSPFLEISGWKSAVLAGLSAKAEYQDRLTTVNYENLVQNPEENMSEICDFLGIEYESGMIQLSYRNSAQLGLRKVREIHDSSVGNYRHVLNRYEICFAENYCRIIFRKYFDIHKFTLAERIIAQKYRFLGVFDLVVRLYSRWKLLKPAYFVAYLYNLKIRFSRL